MKKIIAYNKSGSILCVGKNNLLGAILLGLSYRGLDVRILGRLAVDPGLVGGIQLKDFRRQGHTSAAADAAA